MRVAWLLVVLGLVSAVPRSRRGLAWAAGLFVIGPLPAIGCLAGAAGISAYRRQRQRRVEVRLIAAELPLLGDLVGLGLSSGRTFAASIEMAAAQLRSPLGAEVMAVMRRTSRDGAALVLAGSEGAAGRLYQLAGRALTTGAPLAAAVAAFTEEVRATQRAASLAAARRLPVLLMFPLALLILPGFVLLTVAPAVAGALERLTL